MRHSGVAESWLRPPLVYLVTDDRREASDLVERVDAAVYGGVRLVQVREKRLAAGALFDLTMLLRERLAGRAALLVNDRLDVALAAGVDGVHLPAAGLAPAAARRVAGNLLVGRSVHSADEAELIATEGVDYFLVGTIFPTHSHPGAVPAGLELVRSTRARTRVPLLAIGGMTAARAIDVIAAGADGVAAMSAILDAPDSGRAAADLQSAVWRGWESRRLARPRMEALA